MGRGSSSYTVFEIEIFGWMVDGKKEVYDMTFWMMSFDITGKLSKRWWVKVTKTKVNEISVFHSGQLASTKDTSTADKYTPPETNIAPENRPLEKEIPIGNHYFQGLC